MLREVKCFGSASVAAAIAQSGVSSRGESPAVPQSPLVGPKNHSNLDVDNVGAVKVPARGREVTEARHANAPPRCTDSTARALLDKGADFIGLFPSLHHPHLTSPPPPLTPLPCRQELPSPTACPRGARAPSQAVRCAHPGGRSRTLRGPWCRQWTSTRPPSL